MVDTPQWLLKKRKQLPSPDIRQYHVALLLAVLLSGLGYYSLSGTIVRSHPAVNLVLSIVMISVGSGVGIAACCDSFINGLAFHIDQVFLNSFLINIGVTIGPLFAGFLLDYCTNGGCKPILKFLVLEEAAVVFVYILVVLSQYLFSKWNRRAVSNIQDQRSPVELEKKVVPVHRAVDSNEIFVYGSTLKHVCWWKRTLNVRFSYVQWLESGWSKDNFESKSLPENIEESYEQL